MSGIIMWWRGIIPPSAPAAVLCALAAVFLGIVPASGGETVRIGGSGGALGTIRLLAAAYGRQHPDTSLEVLPSLGSDGALKAVAEGVIDIGIVSRPLRPEERALGLTVLPYARTPFVFVVNPACGLKSVTSAELVRFYGERGVQCPSCGKRLRIVLRPAGDSDTILLSSVSPEMQSALDRAFARPGMFVAVTDQEAADVVGGGIARFGTSTLSLLISEDRQLRALAFDGVVPTVGTLADGSYPLSKTFQAVTREAPSGETSRVLEFLRSVEGREILLETGNLPLGPDGTP